MSNLNLMQQMHKKTKRNYIQRVTEFDKAECAGIAKQFGSDYWDGQRQFGYGGYNYDGRWLPLAKNLAAVYNLQAGQRLLDIGCGKGYLLYELTKVVPGLQVTGLDISKYAIDNAKEEVKGNLIQGDAVKLPFPTNDFDVVISLGTLHNLKIEDVFKAIKEINRVSVKDKAYIMVESWRSETEKTNLLYWQLTCETFLSVDSWEWVLSECGYRGDWDFIFFE